MSKRAMLFWLLMLAAVAAGVGMWNRSVYGVSLRRESSIFMSGVLRRASEKVGALYYYLAITGAHKSGFTQNETWVQAYNKRRKALPGDKALILGWPPPEVLLKLAQAHPERPWYLWRWLEKSTPPPRVLWGVGRKRVNGGRSETDKERERSEKYFEHLNFMSANDPDNGLALFYLALFHANRGSVEEYTADGGDVRLTIIDPASLMLAAEFVHEAVRKERFTAYSREMAREIVDAYGPVKTFDDVEFVREAISRNQAYGDSTFYGIGGFNRRMIAWARRRLEGDEDDANAESVFKLLCDLQDLGVCMDASVGLRQIKEATEQGVVILNAAGRKTSAAQLLRRGATLLGPYLPSILRISHNSSEKSGVWEDIPGLTEKIRLLNLKMADADSDWKGYYYMYSPVLRDLAFSRSSVERDEEFHAYFKFAAWAEAKALANQFSGAVWLVFVCLLVLHALSCLVAKLRVGDVAAVPFPSIRRIVAASMVFAMFAVGPILVATVLCPGRDIIALSSSAPRVFWGMWGLLAAGAALWLVSRRSFRPAEDAGPFSLKGFRPNGGVEWMMLLTLLATAVAGGVLVEICLGVDRDGASLHRDELFIAAASVVLLGAAVVTAGALLLKLMFLFTRRHPPTLPERVVLAGLAGGLLLFISQWNGVNVPGS